MYNTQYPVDHVQVELLNYRLVIPMCGAFGWPEGGGVGNRDLVISIVGIMTTSC